MEVQRVTRMIGVRKSVCVRWERPRCSAPSATADAALVAPASAHQVFGRHLAQIPE